MSVPFLDLRAQDAEVGAEVRAAVGEVLDTQQLVLGPHVERFEAAMAAYCGVRSRASGSIREPMRWRSL